MQKQIELVKVVNDKDALKLGLEGDASSNSEAKIWDSLVARGQANGVECFRKWGT